MEAILSYLLAYWPGVALALILAWITYRVGGWQKGISSDMGELKRGLDKLEGIPETARNIQRDLKENAEKLREVSVTVTGHHSDIRDLRGEVEKLVGLREDVLMIKSQLSRKQPPARSYTRAKSPLSLSPAGEEMAKKLGIASRIASNWSKIEACIDRDVKDKNAYDIQQFCIRKATVDLPEFFSEEDILAIKDVAFNEGEPVESFGELIGVLVRDAYFKSRGINVKEVDKHDPARGNG
jgi:hypothetical protein